MIAAVASRQAAEDEASRLQTRVAQALDEFPDSLFETVSSEDLLESHIYLQLKREGWSQSEIEAIMRTALRDRYAAKGKASYADYTKRWLPYQRLGIGEDMAPSEPPTDDVVEGFGVRRSAEAGSTDIYGGMTGSEYYNKVWPEIEYTPDDRRAGRRNPGYFRPAKFQPSSGRVVWGVVHPTDPNKVMFQGDGASVWRTDNCLDIHGWRNITDNIPERAYRSNSGHSAIPVDPDDWNHIFAMMTSSGNTVWESRDGGDTWRRIKGATHHNFKRGYCFRDAAGNLKFIGAVAEHWSRYPGRAHNRLMISEDTCKTWTNLTASLVDPDGMDLQDFLPGHGDGAPTHGLWFQEFGFDPKDRDRIYVPTSRSILYFDDGAASTLVAGKRKYNLRKMRMKVHGRTLDSPVLNDTCPYNFPVLANGPGHMVIDPNNPNRMWFATGNRSNNYSALYFTENRGEDWITLYDKWNEIGTDTGGGVSIFGNEVAWTWLGGFAVNLADNRYMYGCSMSSAWSESDWLNGEDTYFRHKGWGGSQLALHDDGNYYYSSYARHQADNHFLMSHPSGRVYRGCDGGLIIVDPEINNRAWTHIDGNANQMLCYRVQVNEFGDQQMASNTQDIDVQFYAYGRWGMWAGYEGCNSCINPYSNVTWYPLGGSHGLDPGQWSDNSWAECITHADVVNNTFYLINTYNPEGKKFGRWDDLGRSNVGLDEALGGVPGYYNWGLCRDKGRCTIYALIAGGRLRRSIDQGETFEDVLYNGRPTAFTGVLAVDPDNSDVVYMGQQGRVVLVDLANNSMSVLTQQGLPNHGCSQLIFHEGTGDLYFVSNGAGIWYLEKGASEWKFWLKGYNSCNGNSHVINYTTQEMVFSDYGRGIWVADLQRPADRYFRNGFKLKELSNNGGVKTIGIDTYFTVPLYYNYQWTVNGEDAGHPYQNLTRRLQPGDRVQLKLTLRESPDVSTLSEVYTVKETEAVPVEHTPGNALYSTGEGRVDIGFVSHFLNDFTVDLWVRPQTDGAIIGNCQRDGMIGAKGWIMSIEGGNLKFKYSPRSVFRAPSFERTNTEYMSTHDCGSISFDNWHHIALSHTRYGKIRVYVDGRLTAEVDRRLTDDCLNNSLCLSLLGDGIDRYPIRGWVDEVKVWKRALDQDEIRREMFSTNIGNGEDLVMLYDFNKTELAQNTETYSGYVPHPRTRAVTSAAVSPLAICAKAATLGTAVAGQPTAFVTPGNSTLVTLTSQRQQDIEMGVYAYETATWKTDASNLSSRYYDVMPSGLMIHSFNPVDTAERADIEIHPDGNAFSPDVKYRLYWSEGTTEKEFWNLCAELTYDPETGTLRLPDAPLGHLLDKRLVVVAPKPALEVTINGLNTKGVYEVHNPRQTTITLNVRTLQNLEEPLDGYEIVSDNGLLMPQGKLEFKHGEATVDMRIDMSRFTERHQTLTTTLRGKDSELMIPLTISIVNEITNADAGTGLTIQGGFAMVGNAATYQKMVGSTHYTISTWVRNDDAGWSANTNHQFFWFPSGFGLMANGGTMKVRYYGGETNVSCPLNASTLGKWMHVAVVVDGRVLKFYVNGHLRNTVTAGNNIIFASAAPLMLGSPNSSQAWTYFRGAFDQVGVWNRALSQEEVVHYMQNRVTLDSPQLISYVTMEDVDDQQRMIDIVSGATVYESGTTVRNEVSTFPYNPAAQTDGTGGTLAVAYPAGKSRSTVVSTFGGQSTNFLAADENGLTSLIPLNREHYTIAFDAPGTVANTDQVTLTYTHPTVRQGDAVKLGVREFGAVSVPYTTFIDAASVENGVATFTLPFSQLANSAELMAFVPRSEELRGATVGTTIDDAQLAVTEGRVKLRESDTSVPVTVRLTSGEVNQPVSVFVKESSYATPSVQTVDFSAGDVVTFNIDIDRSHLDAKALNPVTVSFPGIDNSEFAFNVYLEPKVTLRLCNGANENTFLATAPIVDLEIEARLEHGWLDKPVELEITTDLSSSTSIGNGSLLSNSPVKISNLEHHSSFVTEAVEGWNLIGNPYLANINLTKFQNVSFDPEKVTKFVYSYNAATGNYDVFDMTRYDARQAIKPFESYFVQTMAGNASLTVTPVATEAAPTKKTTALAPTEARYAVVELLADGKVADRAVMTWDNDASEAFVINEDAPKFWSINSNTNQICFMASDVASAYDAVGSQTTPTAVCSVREFFGATPFGVKVTTPGRMEVRVAECSGIDPDQEFYLQNNLTGETFSLVPGGEAVALSDLTPGQLDTHYSFLRNKTSGVGSVKHDSPYTVETGENTLLVKGLRGDATVSIFRLNGILVASQHVAATSFKATVETGYYIVKINEGGKEYAVKVGVR